MQQVVGSTVSATASAAHANRQDAVIALGGEFGLNLLTQMYLLDRLIDGVDLTRLKRTTPEIRSKGEIGDDLSATVASLQELFVDAYNRCRY
ncbi:hypothetical protein OH492_12635 [Vibrio chagasii]|nr:hypothetical protein [Vibrio chagasii]